MKKKILVLLMFIILICIYALVFIVKIKEESVKEIPETFENKQDIVEPKQYRMSLVAVGDALIHDSIYKDAYIGDNKYDFSSMFTDIEPLIKDYDLKYYNQETIIGGKDLGLSNYPMFNSPDEIGADLVNIGFNLISLANNHSLDKGERGILYSVNFWNNQDVVFSGQSDSFENRNNIKVYEQNGIKYAFIAYTDTTNGLSIPNGKDYLLNVYSDEQAKKDIESIKDKVDVIIVSMHWGEEYTHAITSTQKKEAEYLSSLGVNVIIGSHPHVIQPVEYVGDTLVIYSLGNFISAQKILGLSKIIGLMVGFDIVVEDSKVTFENINYELLYTYCDSHYKNYKVIPFSNLTEDILPNYNNVKEEYMNIVTGGE